MSGLRPLDLDILPETFAICRLDPSGPLPPWAESGALRSATRTPSELSIVCRDDAVPAGVTANRGWRAIAVSGTLDFALTGILASIAGPLAAADVSLFAVSTHDTDYVLVRQETLSRAAAALAAAGHRLPERAP
ncbi:MAG TPA: ACT domain-containing protein [Thermoanaerobaculia bacterium]